MSWIALRYRKCLEELGFKQYWNLFFGPPPFTRVDIQSPIDHCKAPLNFFFLNSSKTSSNKTAPSSSRRTDWSWRGNRVMAFDTEKQSWRYFSGLMSIHFSFTQRVRNGRQRHCGLQSWSCFGNRSPWSSMQFILNGFCRFGHILFNSVRDSNPRSCSVLKHRFDLNFKTVTILMETNLYVQDWADSRILENPPFRSSLLFVSRQSKFSAWMFHLIWSFFCIKREEVLSFSDNLQTSVRAQYG